MIDLSGGDIQLADHAPAVVRGAALASYGPAGGDARLVSLLRDLKGAEAGELIVTTGASMGLVATLGVLGSRAGVLLPECAYPGFKGIARVLGLATGRYRLSRSAFSAVNKIGARCLILNMPHNPTGLVPTVDALSQLLRFCVAEDISIVIDEVYQHLWDEPHEFISTAGAAGVTVVRVGSLSKQLALAGARVGYVIAPPDLAASIARDHFALAMSPPAVGQEVASVILQRPDLIDWHRALAREIDRRRQIARAVFSSDFEMDGTGTPFFWFDLAHLGGGRSGFIDVARRAGIWVADGSSFFVESDAHVRINLGAGTDEEFKRAIEILGRLRDAIAKGASK